jgi:hypothetical protein
MLIFSSSGREVCTIFFVSSEHALGALLTPPPKHFCYRRGDIPTSQQALSEDDLREFPPSTCSVGARADETYVPYMRIRTPGSSNCAKARNSYLVLASAESQEICIFDISQRRLDSTIDASDHFAEGDERAVYGLVFLIRVLSFVDHGSPRSIMSNSTNTWCFSLGRRSCQSSTVDVDPESP